MQCTEIGRYGGSIVRSIERGGIYYVDRKGDYLPLLGRLEGEVECSVDTPRGACIVPTTRILPTTQSTNLCRCLREQRTGLGGGRRGGVVDGKGESK